MYDDHYGLAGRPFQLTPDPKFWFETATHRKAMAYLGYGLAQSEGFIVITGDIGAGKTTLVGHLVDTIDPDAMNVVKIVSTAIEADDLLRIVATQFGMDPAGLTKAQLLTVIERGLHAVARTGRRTLLIVDEAQALPVSALEELRMLSNFQAGGHALLQIVLLGQPEFRAALHGSDRLEQLRQRVIAIHHLDPMEEHEVADYIAHRLSVVGWQGRPDFAADAFEALYRGSEGVPRRLNLLAGRVMLQAAIENLSLIDGRTVRGVLRDLHADLPVVALTPPPVRDAIGEPAEPVAAAPSSPIEAERRGFVPRSPRWLIAAADQGQTAADEIEPAEAPSTMAATEMVDPAEVATSATDEVGDEEPIDDASSMVEEVAGPAPADAPIDGPADEKSPAGAGAGDERLAALEARLEQQDAALRRVLTLLVDWVEADKVTAAPAASAYVPIRSPAAWDDAA